jgi:hypothetical protein
MRAGIFPTAEGSLDEGGIFPTPEGSPDDPNEDWGIHVSRRQTG